MDQGTRSDGQTMSAEENQREPVQVEREIEATREELGETVAALASKADVKAQVQEKKQEVKARAQGMLGKAADASPDGVASTARQASARARRNPLPFAVAGAFALGLLLGRRRSR